MFTIRMHHQDLKAARPLKLRCLCCGHEHLLNVGDDKEVKLVEPMLPEHSALLWGRLDVQSRHQLLCNKNVQRR